MARRRLRRLVTERGRFTWWVRHFHDPGAVPPVSCNVAVGFGREGSRGRLDIVFREDAARRIRGHVAQANWVVRAGSEALNLHEPGVVRVLLDGALDGGWDPAVTGRTQLDGWLLAEPLFAARPR